MVDEGEVSLRPIFEFYRSSTEADGRVRGAFRATGYLPSYIDELVLRGLIRPGEAYL